MGSNPTVIPTVPTIAALRQIPYDVAPWYPQVQALGYYAAGDTGYQPFYAWNPNAVAADDGGSVINPTGNPGNGRYLLQSDGAPVSTAIFGVQQGTTTDQTARLQAFFAAFPNGGSFKWEPGVTRLKGRQQLATWNSISGLVLDVEGVTIQYDPTDPIPPSGVLWTLFVLNNVTDFRRIGTLTVIGVNTQASIGAGISACGVRISYCNGACKRLYFGPLVITGCGLGDEVDNRPTIAIAGITNIGDAGTGYTDGDVVTIPGGVGSTPATASLTVTTGVVVGAKLLTGGLYPFVGDSSTLPPISPSAAGAAVSGGAGTGLLLNLLTTYADMTQIAEDITFTSVHAKNCFYVGQVTYGGIGVDLGFSISDHCYRHWVLGGCQNVKGTMRIGDTVGDALAMGALYGLGSFNMDLEIILLPAVTANFSEGRAISRINLNNNSYPSVWTNINLRFNAVWGSVTGRGGSLFQFDLVDAVGRGNQLIGLSWSGLVSGTGDQDSGCGPSCLIGMNNMAWPSQDSFSDLNFDIYSRGGSRIAITPYPLNSPIYLNNSNLDSSVYFNEAATGSAYRSARAAIDPGSSNFTNRYTYDGSASPNVGTLQIDTDQSILAVWSGYYVYPGAGTGSPVVYSLPPAVPGLEYQIGAGTTAAGSTVHLTPNGTDFFRGSSATHYLNLAALGTQVRIRCDLTGVWEIVSAFGTYAFV